MPDQEKARNFCDMVDAVEKLTKPIQEENERLHTQLDKLHKQLFGERLIWGIALVAFILLAYLTPDTSYQYQDFEEKAQVQSTGSEVVTQGG